MLCVSVPDNLMYLVDKTLLVSALIVSSHLVLGGGSREGINQCSCSKALIMYIFGCMGQRWVLTNSDWFSQVGEPTSAK